MTPSRPNPRIRADWKRTRREFEAAARASQERRIAAAHTLAASRALAQAYDVFPLTPVASRYARRLRSAYLDDVEKRGEFVNPSQFAEIRGREVASGLALPIYLAIAAWVLTTTISAPYSLLATILWSAFQLVVYFVVWTIVFLAPFQLIGSKIAEYRYANVVDDYQAYYRWSASVESDKTNVCVCSHVNGVHDATCPAVRIT